MTALRFQTSPDSLHRVSQHYKEELPGSRGSMRGYILTYSRLLRENICQLWVLNRGGFNFCICSSLLQVTGGRHDPVPEFEMTAVGARCLHSSCPKQVICPSTFCQHSVLPFTARTRCLGSLLASK